MFVSLIKSQFAVIKVRKTTFVSLNTHQHGAKVTINLWEESWFWISSESCWHTGAALLWLSHVCDWWRSSDRINTLSVSLTWRRFTPEEVWLQLVSRGWRCESRRQCGVLLRSNTAKLRHICDVWRWYDTISDRSSVCSLHRSTRGPHPGTERAESGTGSLWEVLVCKNKSLYVGE